MVRKFRDPSEIFITQRSFKIVAHVTLVQFNVMQQSSRIGTINGDHRFVLYHFSYNFEKSCFNYGLILIGRGFRP